MAPVTDKVNLSVDPKRNHDDESDEGFVSPSVQRIGLKMRKDSTSSLRSGPLRQSDSESSSSSNSGSDNDSQAESSSLSSSSSSSPPSSQQPLQQPNSDGETEDAEINQKMTANGVNKIPSAAAAPSRGTAPPAGGGGGTPPAAGAGSNNSSGAAAASNGDTNAVVSKDAVESKAESLAKFIVYTLLDKTNGSESSDKVERTLMKCVRMMMDRHQILLKGMMKRLQVTRETGYMSFVTVANALFEDEKMVVTWSRIVALYAFGGQLALHCKEKNMEDFACTISVFMGKYAKEVLTPYVMSIGGWNKICEEFPEESDIENKIRRVLSWTAVGLGVAATVSYLTSR